MPPTLHGGAGVQGGLALVTLTALRRSTQGNRFVVSLCSPHGAVLPQQDSASSSAPHPLFGPTAPIICASEAGSED